MAKAEKASTPGQNAGGTIEIEYCFISILARHISHKVTPLTSRVRGGGVRGEEGGGR